MRLIFKTLLSLSLTVLDVYTIQAQIEKHCLPISESRFVHERMVKSYYLEQLADTLQSKVVLLETQSDKDWSYFNEQLAIKNEQITIQKQLVVYQEGLTESYKTQSEYRGKELKKKNVRLMPKLLIAFGVGYFIAEVVD